ncbi:YggT family protein [Nocardioides solisilvae]|uniref:YggT family protein n=1 Tax=Nocardioides solisilvae TaxID=1542435 RepID=UPI000D748735|nr:YggT family protein [Nocardioides solisilvae]
MVVVGTVLYAVLWCFLALMFVRFVVDWVQVFARQWSPKGPLLVVLEGVYSATDPPIKAVRRYVPPVRLGSVALDLSFMIVLIAAYLLLWVVSGTFGVAGG